MKTKAFYALVLTLGTLSTVSAATITPGFTFSVASGGGASTTGSHFHSNTGGVFGNPAGKAEVGNFSSEEVRGLSEWNLAGLSSGSAFVNFTVFDNGGLFTGVNDFPFDGVIDVYAYYGNNLEDISDFQISTIGFVGSFNTTGLNVGDAVSFDISSIFNASIADAEDSLGIRLQKAPGVDTRGGAYTFENITLTTTPQGTVITPPSVPETIPMASTLSLAFLSLGYFRRYLKK